VQSVGFGFADLQRWRGPAVIAAALAVLGGCALAGYVSIGRFEAHARLVEHTHQVRLEIEELKSLFVRARLYWRLYLVSGAEENLRQFESLGADLARQLDGIGRLTADHPQQGRRLAELAGIIGRDLRDLEARASIRRGGTTADAGALLERLGSTGPAVSEVIRLTGELDAEEQRLLAERAREAGRSAQQSRIAIVAGSGLALVVLLAAFMRLWREVGERQRAELEAARRADEIEDLYNKAPVGYHSVDESGRFTRINDTWLAWLGYRREELVGRRRHPDIMTADSAERFEREHFPAFKRDGFLRDVEFDYLRRDGSVLTGSLNASTVRDAAGRYQSSRTTVTDISARKRIERELRDANRELEAFSYTVSHDLRAPLRAVDGYSQMLQEDCGPRLDEEGRRLLGVVREEAARMGQLIDDLLRLSQVGRRPLERQAFDMRALAAEVVAELAPGYPAATVDVAQLPAATGDRALLRQVWINLVGNALKYSSRSPGPRVEIDGNVEGASAVYVVRDNGAGFDMRYQDKLFRAFQRLHRQEEFPGTGIGLAIVERVVRRHGGRVWAQSAPGAGAAFHFSLPREG
jgi:PAS domain S-box-containing protein